MPYIWTYPDDFFTYHGVTVYYLYRDDQIDSGAYYCRFTVNPSSGDKDREDAGVFDLRDAPNPHGHDIEDPYADEARKALLRELIDAGILRQNEPVVWPNMTDTVTEAGKEQSV